MAKEALGQDSLIGRSFGHYRIVEKIGAGGMGVIYRARDEHLDRDVALKILPVGALGDDASRKRFRKEALALSKLNHANIATVHDFDTHHGIDFLIEELIEGISLDQLLASGPLSEKEIVDLGSQLCDGLVTAHEHGIIHRDLKPANIRVTPEGRLKILDFGLAKSLHSERAQSQDLSASETQTVVGTLPYMSPEQLRNEKLDARTDIWAAGCVLYEMATGRRPFLGSGSELINDILTQPPPSPVRLNSKIPAGVEAIILKCLEKNPDLRYASAREIAVDLHRLSVPAAVVLPKTKSRRPVAIAILSCGIVIVILAVGLLLRIRRAQALTEKDTIVLADFDNKTGDAVFDDTLKQALAIHLEQSPFLNVLSDERVNETLRLMGRQPGERLTSEVARDLCQRAGSKALLAGSIATIGSRYVVGLKAIQCSSGDSLAKEQTEAASKEQVLKAVADGANALRRKLGESLPSVQKFDTPLEQATTSSLEALKAYTAGWRVFQERGDLPAIPFYRRAIELDPNFALAYSQLAVAYSNTGQVNRSSEAAAKAYALRERVSEHERYRITAYYHEFVTGDLLKGQEAYGLWSSTYPRDLIPYIDLSGNYMGLGQWEQALPLAQEALRIEPQNVFVWINLIFTEMALNHPEQARRDLDEARARGLDAYFFDLAQYYLAFLAHDTEGMKQQFSSQAGKAEEHWFLAAQSDTEAYFGRLAESRRLSHRAVDAASAVDAKETAAIWQTVGALHEAEVGHPKAARQQALAALALASTKDIRALAALALARSGESFESQKLAEELRQDFPSNTAVQAWLPCIKAAGELNRNRGEEAIETLSQVRAYELGEPPGFWYAMMYPAFLRGQAFLAIGKGAEAAVEFQKFIDHRGVVLNFPLGALARLGLARAWGLQRDKTKALEGYREFLTLWKDADPDLRTLQEARAEYARLIR